MLGWLSLHPAACVVKRPPPCHSAREINQSRAWDPQRPKGGYNITIYHTFNDEVGQARAGISGPPSRAPCVLAVPPARARSLHACTCRRAGAGLCARNRASRALLMQLCWRPPCPARAGGLLPGPQVGVQQVRRPHPEGHEPQAAARRLQVGAWVVCRATQGRMRVCVRWAWFGFSGSAHAGATGDRRVFHRAVCNSPRSSSRVTLPPWFTREVGLLAAVARGIPC